MSGQYIGEENHTLTVAEMPSHNHAVNDPGHSHNVSPNGATVGTGLATIAGAMAGNFLPAGNSQALSINPATTGISIQTSGASAAHNNIQPYDATTVAADVHGLMFGLHKD